MFQFIKKKYFIVLVVFFTISTQAQVKCIVENYSTENGLSHDGIMDIIKGKDGFMWFGSWDGLNRFDGSNFINYKARPGYSSKLANNRVNKVKEDYLGYLWIKADDDQIYRFNKKKEVFIALSDSIDTHKHNFLRIYPYSKNVWLTTEKHGVYLISYKDSINFKTTHYSENADKNYQLKSNDIHFVYEQDDESVWIGTSKGLSFFKKNKKGVFEFDNNFVDLEFTGIDEGQNKVWFTTREGVLIYYDKVLKKFYQQIISKNSLRGVRVSKKVNVVYVTTSTGQIIKVNASTLEIENQYQLKEESFYSIFEDTRGLLWIEPEVNGVIKFDPQKETFKTYTQKNDATFQIYEKSYDVFEDKYNRLWVRMKGGGFGYYDESLDNIHHFYNKNGETNYLNSNIITARYLDSTGILWLVTNDGGIDKVIFQKDYFKHHLLFEKTDNKSDNEIRGVLSDSKGRLWLAAKSNKLIIKKNNNEIKNLFVNWPKEGIQLIYNLFEDSKGNVWIGTKGNGLYKAEPLNISRSKYKITHFVHNQHDINSISGNRIYTVFEDSNNNIWVGNYGSGINVIVERNGKIIFKNIRNSLINYPYSTCNKVRYISEDNKGRIWIATTNGLLVTNPKSDNYDSLNFDYYHNISEDITSLPSNDVLFFYKDSDANMWLSTSGGGLSKVINQGDSLTFKTYTTKQGLSSDFILSMIEDNHKNLWLTTENGITKLNLYDYSFRNYDSYDGLYKTSFSESSSVKLPNNHLLFGCVKGYIEFNPDDIMDDKINADIGFTKLDINNQEVDIISDKSPLKQNINYNNKITLDYTQNTIGINYQVLDYRSNNKQIYAYRLNGLDKVWHNVKNQKKATYTNLAPGKYVFEVKCLNDELYLNIPYKTIVITITPPFWKTNWAYFIYFVCIVLLLEVIRRIAFSMIRLRNKVAVEHQLTELKLNFFTNISHELRTPLTLIVNPIEEIALNENLSARGNEYMEVVRKNTSRMVRFVNQLLDFRKVQSGKAKLSPKRIELISFVNQIASLFSEAAYEKNIELKIVSNTDKFFVKVDDKKIDIVIYNLLSNAFKFSPENKTITVEIIKNEDDSFVIKVIDQGIGVESDKLKEIFKLYYEGEGNKVEYIEGTGIGLALCKEYVKLHNGKIYASNNVDEGLTVTIKMNSIKEEETERLTKLTTSYPIKIEEKKKTVADLNISKTQHQEEDEIKQNLPTVLIVEDNNELRRFLSNQLKKTYKIIRASNGKDGLEKAIAHIPDLILSDIMMPVMDGIEFLDKLKNNDTTSHIPIVLLTAKSTVDSKIEALNYGADYYITKPFDTNFLIASVDNLIQKRKKIFESLVADTKTVELSPSEIVVTTKDEAFLKDIIAVVEAEMINPDFKIESFAKSINMRRATFNRKFKSLTNMTAVEFVRDMRLKRAKQMLDAGEKNISEVAFDVGFNSAGYFSTCFKEKYNISPSEYIKHN
ncbi:two-component regulator propeller domain-containing protein [Wenyingzhuangia sp. IMCC45467]